MRFYKEMKIISGRPYEYVYYPSHHLAQKDGTIGVHILVAEDMLNRPLDHNMVVHHIDFNKKNNEPSNLMVFQNKKYHAIYHICLEHQYDYFLFCIDGVYTCARFTKIKKENCSKRIVYQKKCPICGISKKRNNKICWNCYCNQKSNNSLRPNKEEIIDYFTKTPNFVQFGKKYNVSDNAVRKWCKKYGLPTSTKGWKEYF